MFDAAEISKTPFVSVSDETRLSALNAQLAYAAARSPYYRALLGNFTPLSALSELSALPLTDAEQLKAAGRASLCVTAGEVARIVSLSTSGTAGDAKRLYFTENDLAQTLRFFSDGMAWMCRKDDTAAVLMPCAVPDGIGDLLCRALRAIGVRPLPLGLPADMNTICNTLEAERPQVLVGFPWHLRLIALRCPSLRPRAVLLSGDFVPDTLKIFLETQWRTEVLGHFGMTETLYGCAVQHPAGSTLYLRRDALIAEIIDPEAGNILPPGSPGELVLTTLNREALPLVRYRTGDLAVLTEDGNIAKTLGRRAAPTEHYRLQNALAPLLWLWDFLAEGAALTAFISPEAPPDARQQICAAAPEFDVSVTAVPPEEAAPAYIGKRIW